MEDGLRAVRPLDDHVGLGERAVDVAALGAARLARDEPAPDSVIRVEHDLELLPLDLDRLDGSPRLRERVGRNCGDGRAGQPASSSSPCASPGPTAARTPGSASAGARSSRCTLACAWGERRTAAWSIPDT